jgi:hypothetical protein
MYADQNRRRAAIVRHSILLFAALAAIVVVFTRPAVPQGLAYHHFADQRSFAGIPNCLNVLSNVPFAIAGLLGISAAMRNGDRGNAWTRWPYIALFVGVALTTLGSGYYHLRPDNARLVWDRLPMTVGFMGLLTALLAERVSITIGRWLFGPLLLLGAGSVLYWYWSELRHAGDLRLYILVQFGSLLLIVLILLFYPARNAGTGYVVAALVAYAAAKVFEAADNEIFSLGHFVSGHTIKHLTAATGVAFLVAMQRARMRTQ